MSEAAEILFDTAFVENGARRASITKLVTSELRWRQAAASGRSYLPTVFIGNAASLSAEASKFLKQRFSAPVALLALVSSDEDRDAADELIEWSGTSRLTLALEFETPKPRSSVSLVAHLERLARRLAPDRIRAAQFARGTLFVVFGDGLAHGFEWKQTRPLARLKSFAPVAAQVSEEFDSVVVVNEAGRQLDVDGLVLRKLIDAPIAADAAHEFSAARLRIGTRLRQLRESARLSQEQLSARSGLPQETISRLESGVRTPRLATFKKLARGLALPLDKLLRAIELRDRD